MTNFVLKLALLFSWQIAQWHLQYKEVYDCYIKFLNVWIKGVDFYGEIF